MFPNPQDKASLRAYWKNEYPKYQSKFTSWSQEICRQIASTDAFKSAEQIAIFRGREWEVDLESLWKLSPKKCYFPRVNLKSEQGMDFYSVNELLELKIGFGGVAEPNVKSERLAEPFKRGDLILVPGLAFDRFGGRIGHGKGFYDRFLSGPSKEAKKWGVCFSPQLRPEAIVQEVRDVRLNALVTENGIIYF